MITQQIWRSLSAVERIGGILGGLMLLGALYGAGRAVLQVPTKLDQHVVQSDSILVNQREQIRLAREANCIAVHVRPEDKLACIAEVP